MNFFKVRVLLLLFALAICFFVSCAGAQQSTLLTQQLANMEMRSGDILGISALDTNTNQHIEYHATKRFPMGCTSKVVAVAAVLKKSAGNANFLQKKVHYTQHDLLEWAPITKQHITDGMPIEQLCAAAISFSDNTAMNLLVQQLGGLQAINNFARSIGDHSFQLNHGWPQEALANVFNSDDSSTPAAMRHILQQLVFSGVLAQSGRDKLKTWLIHNTTGDARIRAGVPHKWIVADKTGTGLYYGTANDIGIIWPPHCAPLIVAIYTTSMRKNAPKREDLISSVTRLLVHDFARRDHCITFS